MSTRMMKHLRSNRLELAIGTVISMVALTALSAGAVAQATTTTTSASTTTSSATQAKLQTVITVGNGEITRRLTTLNNLTTGITASQFLTASDKSSLSSEISTEASDLTGLKTKLDAETTVVAATTDDLNVITEYRVYVLVVPKVNVIIAADRQQATEAALTTTANNFKNAIATAASAGKNVTTLQSELTDLNAQVAAAQSISSSMEAGVINLQPSDYNTDHAILVGDYNKLVTAQNDNETAITDANAMLTGLQGLL